MYMRWFIITDEVKENIKKNEEEQAEKPKNLRQLLSKL